MTFNTLNSLQDYKKRLPKHSSDLAINNHGSKGAYINFIVFTTLHCIENVTIYQENCSLN
jgi:hypothetical protein